MKQTAYLALGSNLGARRFYLREALRLISRFPGTEISAVSPVYDTEPIGCTDPDRYLNLVVRCETELSPEDLLRNCLEAETTLGRRRPYRNAPRTIDIDLLLCGDEQRRTEFLTLPHPRMWERAFVLCPLRDVATEPEVWEKIDRSLAAVSTQDIRRAGRL